MPASRLSNGAAFLFFGVINYNLFKIWLHFALNS
jgi:hypothetical protein